MANLLVPGVSIVRPALLVGRARALCGTSYRGASCGTAFGPAAADLLATLRNPSTNLALIVRRLRFGAIGAAAATAAGAVSFALKLLSAFSADSTGGVAVTCGKDDSTYADAAASLRVVNGAALTPGTATDGAQIKIGGAMLAIGDLADFSVEVDFKETPLVLRANEGLALSNLAAMPTSVTLSPLIEIEFDEVPLSTLL